MNIYLNQADLVSAMETGFRPKWMFFWGHTPSPDGSLGKTCFSQWWGGHPFSVDDVKYATAEHFMMAEKARVFGDEEMRTRILAAKSPAEAKKLGRLVKGFTEEKWLTVRWDIVVRGNEAKFSQHDTLREFLGGTGKRILVEASPFDRIWGIGMAATHADAEKPRQWRGLNLLGFALMKVRSRILQTE